jgi:hypothetical protein
MALSADQRAMLELLLGRGQSYEDIAGVLGTSADEVRSKARWALAELGNGDPDRKVALSDYLLGQADPIGRADAVRHLRDDPADRALAERLLGELHAIAPDAELPSLPGESRTAPHLRAPTVSRRRAADAPPRAPRDPARTRMLVGLTTGAVVLVIVVLAIAGVFGGGDSTPASTASTSTDTASTTPTSTSQLPNGAKNPVAINLKPVGGGPGSGTATLAAATNDQPFLDVQVNDLPPPQNGNVYAAWFVLDTGKRVGYPLAPLVPYNQPYHDDFPVPSVAVPLIAGIKAIDITSTTATDLRAEIKKVIKDPKHPKLVLPEIGQTVLRGTVPRGKAPAGSGSSG